MQRAVVLNKAGMSPAGWVSTRQRRPRTTRMVRLRCYRIHIWKNESRMDVIGALYGLISLFFLRAVSHGSESCDGGSEIFQREWISYTKWCSS